MNDQITKDFKWYYDNGYITARDGNAAYRDGDNFVVTRSGAKKNDLSYYDFVQVDKNVKPSIDNKRKPSIEAAAHIAALIASGKNTSVHVHSPNTVALATLFDSKPENFKPNTSNLVNVLNTRWPELFRHTKVGHIVEFLNPGSKSLHDSIINNLSYWKDKFFYDDDGEVTHMEEVMAYNDIVILQRHGVLAIGDSFEQCMEHIVRLEHVSNILLKIITASGGNLTSIL